MRRHQFSHDKVVVLTGDPNMSHESSHIAKVLQTVTLIYKRDSQLDDWKNRMACWDCKLQYEGRETRLHHMAPYDLGAPDASSVLSDMLSASNSAYVPLTRWLEENGLDNSRETRNLYERVVAVRKALRYLLGDDYQTLASAEPSTIVAGDQDPSSRIELPYRHDGQSIEQLIDFCHNSGLRADSARRRHSGRANVLEAVENWNMAASTAWNSWTDLKSRLGKEITPSTLRVEKQAVRNYQLMLRCIRKYQDAIAE